MLKKILAFASAAATAATLATLGAAAPAYAEGAQFPNTNATCMGWLAEASNPNASGDHIALIAQNGDASTLAQASPSGTGFPALISCVVQIP
jgi:hypothetical protein